MHISWDIIYVSLSRHWRNCMVELWHLIDQWGYNPNQCSKVKQFNTFKITYDNSYSMDKYFMWIHYERLHNHNNAKHNKHVCISLAIYCTSRMCNKYLLIILFYFMSLFFLFFFSSFFSALLVTTGCWPPTLHPVPANLTFVLKNSMSSRIKSKYVFFLPPFLKLWYCHAFLPRGPFY